MIHVASKRCRAIALTALMILSWCVSLAVLAAPALASPSGSYSWPVKGRVITEFKKPTGPYGKGGHQGVDIAAAQGTTVRAAGEGKVVWSGELPRGRYVSISHSGGVKTTYLDLLEIYVKQGDTVTRGQAIGTVNGVRDCSSSEPHLHFSASMNGTPIDPRVLIDGTDSGSYIRLCPVSGEAHTLPPDGVSDANDHGILDWLGDLGSDTWGLIEEGYGAISSGLGLVTGALSALGQTAWDVHVSMWNTYILPALKSTGGWLADAARWVWNNPYVRAMTAGLLAAAAVVMIIVAAAVAIGASVVVTIVAAVLATVACIGMAIYYAVAHGGDVSFNECFWQAICLMKGTRDLLLYEAPLFLLDLHSQIICDKEL